MIASDSQSKAELSSLAWWNEYFRPNGGWEKNGGRQQTRIFAEHFCACVSIDCPGTFRLLDVGCGLGDALLVFRRKFPQAELHGIDFSPVAVARCKEHLRDQVKLEVGTLDDVAGHYDVIYVSNVLEHFVDFERKSRHLARRCSRLCIMVPYREQESGQDLRPNGNRHHQQTFYESSFDFLLTEGCATQIDRTIVSCPGAWGWSRLQRMVERLKNPIRRVLGKSPAREPLQIIFDIRLSCK
jgi:SAM-dependent methyltransferase